MIWWLLKSWGPKPSLSILFRWSMGDLGSRARKPPGDRQVYQVLRGAPRSTSGSPAPCSPRAACARPPPPALRARAPAQPCRSRRWRNATGAGCLTRNCSLAKFKRICWKSMAFTIQIAQVAEYEQTAPAQQLPPKVGE